MIKIRFQFKVKIGTGFCYVVIMAAFNHIVSKCLTLLISKFSQLGFVSNIEAKGCSFIHIDHHTGSNCSIFLPDILTCFGIPSKFLGNICFAGIP